MENTDLKKYRREYYKKNKQKMKENLKKWQSKNKDKLKEYARKWRSKNKDKFSDYVRIKYYERRKKLLENKKCKMCGIEDWRVLTFDHIESVSKGGSTTKDNLQVLCWNCHRIKSIKNRDWKVTRRKTKSRSFHANLSKERLKEFLEAD